MQRRFLTSRNIKLFFSYLFYRIVNLLDKLYTSRSDKILCKYGLEECTYIYKRRGSCNQSKSINFMHVFFLFPLSHVRWIYDSRFISRSDPDVPSHAQLLWIPPETDKRTIVCPIIEGGSHHHWHSSCLAVQN